MRRWKIWSDDGSASLEFVTVGLILLVPLVYLVLAVSSIQAGAFAAEGAARQAARVYVQQATVADAHAAARRAVRYALTDFGLDPARVRMDVGCAPDPAHCLRRHGRVTVRVSLRVSLPLVPDVLDFRTAASVPIQAAAVERVSRFRRDG